MTFEEEDTTEAHERRQVRCKAFGCNKRIIFLPTENDTRMPVDADSVCAGDDWFDSTRHISHFASCPRGNQFRRRT